MVQRVKTPFRQSLQRTDGRRPNMIMAMWEWETPHGALPWLVTAVSLLILSRIVAALNNTAHPSTVKERTSSGSTNTHVAIVDGSHLYYDKTRWPQYEARFNLRLSYIYGPVVTIKLGATNSAERFCHWLYRCLHSKWRPSYTTILINSLADDDGTLRSLLSSSASRAPSITAGKYLSQGRRIVLQPYGTDWQRHRRAFASLLTKEKTKSLWSKAIQFEAMVMVDRISRLIQLPVVPDITLLKEISRFTASNVLQIAYARRVSTPDDPILSELEIVSQNISDAFTAGKYWVEKLPVLDWFPALLSPWKRKLNASHEFEKGVFSRLLQDVERKLVGTEAPQADAAVIPVEECGAAQLLQNQQSLQMDRDDIAYLAAGLFEAGTETTAMTINTFLIAAACYPTMVQKAQTVIDQYIQSNYGNEAAVPTFHDLQKLQYLGAVVKETLRLTPTGSSGIGHTSTAREVQLLYLPQEDDQGNRKRLDIPPDTTVLGNIYGLHHDPKLFPDPWGFQPDRWLPSGSGREEGQVSKEGKAQAPHNCLDHCHINAHYFGFGRRICPGATLATYTLSMAIALLLLCFDFDLTDEAPSVCAEMEQINSDEDRKWSSLYPDIKGNHWGSQQEPGLGGSTQHETTKGRIGRVLIDAHVTFKLSRSRLAECIRLQPRKDGAGLLAVHGALATMYDHYNIDLCA